MGFLDILFVIVAVLIIIASLFQGGKSAGASGAIMGGGMNLFTNIKERGVEKLITRIIYVSGIIFMVLAVLIKIYAI